MVKVGMRREPGGGHSCPPDFDGPNPGRQECLPHVSIVLASPRFYFPWSTRVKLSRKARWVKRLPWMFSDDRMG